MEPDTIPVDVEELDAAFFSKALARAVGDAARTIEKIEILDRHSGTTGRVRVAFPGASDGVPASVFVKLAPFDATQRKFVDQVGMGVTEARFYRDLAAEVPVRVPAVWYAEFDAERRYVMVLEDLAARGCRFPKPRDPDVATFAGAFIEELARLHAPYWESARFAGDLAWVRGPLGKRGGGEIGARLVTMAVEAFGDEMPDTFRRMATLFIDHQPEIQELLDGGPQSLVHGDAHMGNLFADGERPGFLDWAMLHHGPALRDVAYFLCNSVPVEVRRTHQDEWLTRYRATLALGNVDIDPDVMWEGYRLHAVSSWVAATTTAAMGSKWQDIKVGRGATDRATTALADLDTIGLIEEKLGRS